MKKINQLIFIILTMLCSLANAELIDDSSQVNPLISLRSLATGVPLNNQQFQDDRKFVWQISEIFPEQSDLRQAGLTQFRAVNTNRCLYSIQNRIITASCDPQDNGSLWQIIPTQLGGVQVKSLRVGKCLSAGNSYDDFILAPCQEDESRVASVKLLWVFAPAAVNASLVPIL